MVFLTVFFVTFLIGFFSTTFFTEVVLAVAFFPATFLVATAVTFFAVTFLVATAVAFFATVGRDADALVVAFFVVLPVDGIVNSLAWQRMHAGRPYQLTKRLLTIVSDEWFEIQDLSDNLLRPRCDGGPRCDGRRRWR